jgi:CDI immunity proteins
MTRHDRPFHSGLSEIERNKSLQELEKQEWRNDDFSSSLVLTCSALRRKSLREFTVEDLRIMIGQNLSLSYLVPLALEHLQHDPFVAGDFFPGDLLANVLKIQPSFWRMRPDLRLAVEDIVEHQKSFPKDLDQALLVFQQKSELD